MTLFDKIKKLFSKPKFEVKFNELESWLDSSVASKLKAIDDQVKEKLQEAEHVVQDVGPALKALEAAKLKNEQIQEKLKNYMTGNRDNYSREINQFIDWIDFPKSEDALEWSKSFIEKVNTFNKSSQKSYFILQEFFADESSALAKLIKKLTDAVLAINALLTGNEVKAINDAKAKIDEINTQTTRKEYLSKQVDELNQRKSEIEQGKAKKEVEIKKLEQSDNFLNHEKRILELKDTNKKINRIDDSVTQLFSPLRRAFKKYSKVGMHNLDLIDIYSDAMKGLMRDPNYRILELLKAVRIGIMKNEVELDDKDKVIRKINDITHDKLETYYLSYKHLNDKKENIEKVLSNDPTLYQIKELNNVSEHLNSELVRVNAEINSCKDEFNKIDVDALKSSLQEDLSNLTDSEVSIS